MNTVSAKTLLSILALLAVGASEFRSDAALDAQRGYQQALQRAKNAYMGALDDAMRSAGKNKDSDEVLRIAEELKRVRAAESTERFGDFPASVIDVESVGSPNMGKITFKHAGSFGG
ncbi:MAG: hypothetical protein H7Z14_00720 [Anaerolineae bacterium]|nr:hypothetical protein [Phycisphaerae bacterium]